MVDWKQRLLEIGLAGGLATAGVSCGQQSLLNTCGASREPAHLANFLDAHPAATSLRGCPLPPTSPPAPYGSPPSKNMFCETDSTTGTTVAIDDMTLGYSPQHVLDAANTGATASLTWWDGKTTKLHFHLDTTPTTGFSILDNPPNAGFCDRSMMILDLVATLNTDDGRLAESIHATIIVTDHGQFALENIALEFDQPSHPGIGQLSAADIKGTLATDFGASLPAAPRDVGFDLSVLPNGITCLPNCFPGVDPNSGNGPGECIGPSGVISASVSFGDGLCPSGADVARWQWD